MRTISIGNQYFDSVREKNSFYIDKTEFIKEWWESNDDVTLITRPRRFGKTLNLSTLECFFSTRYANRGDLFEGLNIWKEEQYRKLQGTYPVIMMSFGSIKGKDFKNTRDLLINVIARAYENHRYLLDGNCLTDEEKKAYNGFERYTNSFDSSRTIDEQLVQNSIHKLSGYLERYYGKKVIIILDEYDTPMQEAYVGGYWEEIVKFLRGMFNSTFKDNPYLERALMSGITRVSKESIFSDLNHLNVVSTTSEQYETCFGFTQDEVFAALDEAEILNEAEKVKNWYDGFTFGSYSDIYNPWSITNFLKKKKYAPYWADTSSNALVSQLIRTGDLGIKETMEQLLKGDYLETSIDEQIVFQELDQGNEKIWSLLLASGNLKIDSYRFDEQMRKNIYHLKLTNWEVEIMFENLISSWFKERKGYFNQFTKYLLRGEVEDMNYYLQEILDANVSSFDVKTKTNTDISELKQYALQFANGELSSEQYEKIIERMKNEKVDPESFYHALVLGMLVELRGIYQVKSNRESGRSRYDVMLIPRDSRDRKITAMVMEFKVFDSKREKSLEDTVERALLQIEEKNYDAELRDIGIEKERIRHFGFGFQGKEVLIKEGLS